MVLINKIDPLNLIINNFRYKKEIINNINKELKWLSKIIVEISLNLDEYNEKEIIDNNLYTECNNKLNNIIIIIENIKKSLSLRRVSYLGSYIIGIKISKIRLFIIKLIENIGCIKLSNIIKLYFNFNILDIYKNNIQVSDIFDLLDNYLKCISCEIYQPKKNDKNTILSTKEFCYNIFKFIKLVSFIDSYLLKISGIKIYIKIKDKLLVISGYIKKVNLKNLIYNTFIIEKIDKIQKYLESQDKVTSYFRYNYINQLSLQEILLFNIKELSNKCYNFNEEIKKIKKKNISVLIKEFIVLDLYSQYNMITSLLIGCKDDENLLVSYILFDILNSSNKNIGNDNYNKIFFNLHWTLRKSLYQAKIHSDTINSNILKITNDSIPLEKQIILLKVPDYVKQKGFEKLREINNTKGENNAKALQYIEGLLKIPFGIYKEESTLKKLEKLKQDYQKISSIFKLKYLDITKIYRNNIVNNILKLKNTVLLDNLEINNILSNYLKIDLQNILESINISKIGTKNKLIEKIIENKSKININILEKYKLLSKNFNKEDYNSLSIFENKWSKYNLSVTKYLDNIDNILDNCVYGMDNAKIEIKRIIAQWINGKNEGYILGFEGPPGTGKTTLAKKGIAKCLIDDNGDERPFCFIALGGSSNGSTLEGHSYCYVGSTWGRLLDCLMESNCMNPIIYIDELDKISKTEQGKEIIGILIHLTDPTQNNEYMDKYYSGIKLDLSKCLIIFSYNDVNNVDKVLLDRIHRIKIKQLNKYEKVKITYKFLLPEICKNVGINLNDINISEEIITYIITNYTYESGVRKLKECLYDIVRDINYKNIKGNEYYKLPIIIDIPFIKKIFYEKNTINVKKIPSQPRIGIVNGLYASTVGLGGITLIESHKFLSSNRLTLELTGQQGDIMKESMKVANTIAWNLLPDIIKQEIRDQEPFGIHIHCPEASTPKDGPSAGVAITIAILSLLSKIPVNNKVAVTGEIDLNGNVLPIGGLETKIEGAISAGVEKILCPRKNKEDLDKITKSVFYLKLNKPDKFEIITIDNIFEALDQILLGGINYENIFNKYYNLELSCEQYLLMFKNLCDKSDEIMCITDTSDNYRILYTSKKLLDIFNKEILLNKSLIEFCIPEYKIEFNKFLNKVNKEKRKLSMKIKFNLINNYMIIKSCKIDNIILSTINLIKETL